MLVLIDCLYLCLIDLIYDLLLLLIFIIDIDKIMWNKRIEIENSNRNNKLIKE